MRLINLSELAKDEIVILDEFAPVRLYQNLLKDKDAKNYPFLIKLNVEKMSIAEFLEWESYFTEYMRKKNVRVLIG